MNKKSEIRLDEPNLKLIGKYNNIFNKEDIYQVSESVLINLFQKLPRNNNLEDVVIKTSTLNSLYWAGILNKDIISIAKNIIQLKIDARIQEHALDIVDDITSIHKYPIKRNYYSFATKYCSFHCPNYYPIYDSYVSKLIIGYSERYGYEKIDRDLLKQYNYFTAKILAFKNHFNLKCSIRELDHFFWLYGREKFSKPS